TAAALLSLGTAVGVILGVERYAQVTRDLPAPETLETLLDPAAGSLLIPTRIVDRSGQNELWRFENQKIPVRRYTPITDGSLFFFSEVPEPLILATVAALDPDYLERPEGFLPGLLDSSPDPIPEILVDELLLWQETDHPFREIRRHLLSSQVVARYGRKKVLEWYLNSAYYGNSIYGAAQAAKYYFGKDLSELDLSESAMMAAVGAFPALNPLDAAPAARENQAAVLDKMAAAGFITSNQAVSAAREKLVYADSDPAGSPPQPAYLDLIVQEAARSIPVERLLRGGFLIVSTIDSQLQDELKCTLDIMAERVRGSQPDLASGCAAGRLLPKYSGPVLNSDTVLEIDLAMLDPIRGELIGLAGLSSAGQNLTVDQPRNPGSLVTPFIYLNDFTQGFEPASLVWDIPLAENEADSDTLHPGCSGDCEYLGPVSIRTALVNDLLSPARQSLTIQGRGRLRSTLSQFGFSLEEAGCQDCPVFPESPDLKMLDVLQGYGVFANHGVLAGRASGISTLEFQPLTVLRIEDTGGMEYQMAAPLEERKIISEELAYLAVQTLSDSTAWLDPQAREFYRIGKPAGVKLGYVPDGSSFWTVGFTRCYHFFLPAAGRVSGMRENPGSIEPLVADTLYQALEVNRETGLLASVFTPADRIEEKIFLKIPPKAQTWAAETNLPRPPTLYDLQAPDPQPDGLELISPENLSFVRDRVWITGSIPEEDFLTARLQFGAGLNPHSWLQIGEELRSPVNGGYLGTWDTSGLEEGIYALQLVLIKTGQEIEKTSLLVSVDNTPPEIILVTDLTGNISYQSGKDLLLEVQFQNSSEIDQVVFRMDGQQLASRKVEPFLTLWPLELGEHHLLVTARDQAGNRSELEVDFNVTRE
ncbi:MAG: transglycosylase domain-containing protein, partial [Anaerolineales bacterium]